MKTAGFLTLLICFFLMNSTGYSQKITIKPDKPQPGEKITVTFDPAGSKLEKSEKISLYAYLYKQDLTNTISADMRKSGKTWSVSFSSGKDDLGAILVFKDDNITETNNKKGFLINFYNKNGDILPGSLAGAGLAFYSWGSYYAELDPDPALALEMMDRDFTNHPQIKVDYLQYYIPVAVSVNKDKANDIIKDGAAVLSSKKELTEDDYSLLSDLYRRLNDTLSAARYENTAIEKYPAGSMVQRKEFMRINGLQDINSKISAAKEFGRSYPESDFLPNIHNSIIKALLQSKDYEKLKNFITDEQKIVLPYFFQDTAIKILKAGGSPETALAIASAGSAVFSEKIRTDKKPEYLSQSDYDKSNVEMEGQMLFAKGRALYELNKKKEAADVLKSAVEKNDYKATDINYYYSKSLADINESKKSLDALSSFISEGNSTAEMKPLLKEMYIKVKGSDKDYEKFVQGLDEKANKKIASELEKEMIDEEAPLFSLSDLQGKQVSLESLKGKVVVVDFWATWCGPCLASFPGMKKAVEMYSGKDDVKFLFVNTSERVQDKKQNAQDFLTKNNYPFHVLLDLDSSVRVSYKVPGIPTKFVIDKNGHIRFKKVGYEGNDDKMVSEIAAMISLLQ